LDFIDEDSINYVFYLFPDPWPKQRQQRRRLFSETFLQNVYRVLKPNGLLYLATDCDYVDEFHRKLLTQTNLFEFKTTDESQWNLPKTNKELFCIEKNIKRYKLICKPRK